MGRGHFESGDLHLNKLGEGPLGNATYQFSSEPSGPEEEDFLTFSYVYLCFKSRTPWHGVSLDPETFI